MSDDPIKDALKMMPYGFYSITTHHEDDVNAMVANWISQVSFEPRLVAIGLQKTSYSRSLIEKGRVFAINLFRLEDKESMMSLTKGRSKKPDKMNEAKFTVAPVTGCPVLEGAAAYIEFKLVDIIDIGGDHDIVVGEAVAANVLKPSKAADMITLPGLGWSYAG